MVGRRLRSAPARGRSCSSAHRSIKRTWRGRSNALSLELSLDKCALFNSCAPQAISICARLQRSPRRDSPADQSAGKAPTSKISRQEAPRTRGAAPRRRRYRVDRFFRLHAQTAVRRIDWPSETRKITNSGGLENCSYSRSKGKGSSRLADPIWLNASYRCPSGDGLGYAIQSFDETGNEIFIEVKTTSAGKNRAFPVSRAELTAQSAVLALLRI